MVTGNFKWPKAHMADAACTGPVYNLDVSMICVP